MCERPGVCVHATISHKAVLLLTTRLNPGRTVLSEPQRELVRRIQLGVLMSEQPGLVCSLPVWPDGTHLVSLVSSSLLEVRIYRRFLHTFKNLEENDTRLHCIHLAVVSHAVIIK